MTSLVLGLALTAAPQTVGHDFRAQPYPYPQPGVNPYRPVGYPPVGYPRPLPVPPPSYYPPTNPGPFPPPHGHGRVYSSPEEFARCFVPTPGRHHVLVVHPKTCRPVEVCFTLPHCHRPPKVDASRYGVEFDYGREEVDIRFRHNGTVDVDYD